MFKTTNYWLPNDEKSKLLDSIRIVNVIDNRPSKDSIIGFALAGIFNKAVPFIIDKPLTAYLKESFNYLIVKDTNQSSYVPVTVYVNEFNSGVEIALPRYAYHKYSYIFEYPNDSNSPKKVQIFDSTSIAAVDPNERMDFLINLEIRNVAKSFVKKYKTDMLKEKSPAKLKNGIKRDVKNDSIDMSKSKLLTTKSGGAFTFFKSNKIETGIGLEFLHLSLLEDSKLELGYVTGIRAMSIKQTESKPNILGLQYDILFDFRYNFFQSLYIDAHAAIYGGFEIVNSKLNFFAGPHFDEMIGLYLSELVSVSFGSYQMWHFGSDILPNDIGLLISISITSRY